MKEIQPINSIEMKQIVLFFGLMVFGASVSFAQCSGSASADTKANVENAETKAACTKTADADKKACCDKSQADAKACADKEAQASKDGKACCDKSKAGASASTDEKAACSKTADADKKACCDKKGGTADASTKSEVKEAAAPSREAAKIAAKK